MASAQESISRPASEDSTTSFSLAASCHRNEPESVDLWRTAASQALQQHGGPISRLYQACISCLSDLRSHSEACKNGFKSRKSRRLLERAYHTLELWGKGYDVLGGRLDEKLGSSNSIKSEVLILLRSVGRILTRRMSSLA